MMLVVLFIYSNYGKETDTEACKVYGERNNVFNS